MVVKDINQRTVKLIFYASYSEYCLLYALSNSLCLLMLKNANFYDERMTLVGLISGQTPLAV